MLKYLSSQLEINIIYNENIIFLASSIFLFVLLSHQLIHQHFYGSFQGQYIYYIEKLLLINIFNLKNLLKINLM